MLRSEGIHLHSSDLFWSRVQQSFPVTLFLCVEMLLLLCGHGKVEGRRKQSMAFNVSRVTVSDDIRTFEKKRTLLCVVNVYFFSFIYLYP